MVGPLAPVKELLMLVDAEACLTPFRGSLPTYYSKAHEDLDEEDLDWVAQSPNLYQRELLWGELERRL